MMVKVHDDRNVGPDDVATHLDDRPLSIVDSLCTGRTVEMEGQTVNLASFDQATADLFLEELLRLESHSPTGRRPCGHDRNGLDVRAGRHNLEISPNREHTF